MGRIVSGKYTTKVQCRICGEWFYHPMSHCFNAHGILSRDYKKRFGLDVSKGLLCPDLKKVMSNNVLSHPEIIAKLQKIGEKVRYKKGDCRAGNYERSEQTLKMLSVVHLSRKKIWKKCEKCGKDMFTVRWRKWCYDCFPEIKNERQRTDISRQYHRDWYKIRTKDPNFIKYRTQSHREWVEKNREHLNSYVRNWGFNLGRKCSGCGSPIRNKNKNGMCIHCFNQRERK